MVRSEPAFKHKKLEALQFWLCECNSKSNPIGPYFQTPITKVISFFYFCGSQDPMGGMEDCGDVGEEAGSWGNGGSSSAWGGLQTKMEKEDLK